MQTNVPQFIDVEDKVIGPFTLKQAGYLLGAGFIIYLLYYFLEAFFFFMIAIPIAILALALAFYRPGDRSFIVQLQNQLSYFFSPKIYLWKRVAILNVETSQKKRKQEKTDIVSKKEKIKNLKELSSVLDRGGKR